MFRSVSFVSPSRAPTEIAMCGGLEVIIMKKLNGARLWTPSELNVEAQPIGLGTTSAAISL
jgi:hypothetical protein